MSADYDPLREDFRNFLYHAFKVLGLTPHEIQYDVADWLQRAGNRRILSCMRGFGKTVIVSCYVAWRFYQDPNRLILVQSASSERAKEIVGLVRQVLSEMDITAHLVPDGRNKSIRNQAQRFDIAVRTRRAKDPSLAAYGHRSMVTGSHVDEIITDDLETPENSITDEGMKLLMEKIAEYEDIIIADTDNIITLIGTPQTDNSIYFAANELGYEMIRVPAEYPNPEDEYYDTIAPFLKENPKPEGTPTYPERMDTKYLEDKKAITPEARYRRQMLLDPTLSDAEKYPLKLKDLIVFDCDTEMMPVRFYWTNDEKYRVMVPVAGHRGDHLFAPRKVEEEYVPFTQKIMWVDPAGRGADSATYCVAYGGPSYIYAAEIDGGVDAFSDRWLDKVALSALKHGVTRIYIESNFGGGAYGELLKPRLHKYGVSAGIEDVTASKQKEVRMLESLRPVMGTHRLICARQVVQNVDLTYQITHLNEDRGCLEHDDYVDALAGAVSKLTVGLSADAVRTTEEVQEARLREMVDAFWERVGDPVEEKGPLDRYGTEKLRKIASMG